MPPVNELTDYETGAPAFVESHDYQIHQGKMFHVSKILENVNANDSISFFFEASDKKASNVFFFVSAGGDAYKRIYEHTVVSDKGTLLEVHNRNRRLADNLSESKIYSSPTVIQLGQLIQEIYLPGGNFPSSPGFAICRENEWILNHGRTYLFQVTNKASTAKTVNLEIQWYEHKV